VRSPQHPHCTHLHPHLHPPTPTCTHTCTHTYTHTCTCAHICTRLRPPALAAPSAPLAGAPRGLRSALSRAAVWGRLRAAPPAARALGGGRRGGGGGAASARLRCTQGARGHTTYYLLLATYLLTAHLPLPAAPKVREALLAWQYAGRDCGARWLAFATPSPAALATLARAAQASEDGGEGGGLVELGAARGYWVRLLWRRGVVPLTALDISPPEGRQPHPPAVTYGTAESLGQAAGGRGVLLLCMPSPGEEDLADTALHHFHGARVAYVGEWGSGMTGTVGLHASLADTRRWALESVVPLPTFVKGRLALHIFARVHAVASAPPAAAASPVAAAARATKRKRGTASTAAAADAGAAAAAGAPPPLAAAARCEACGGGDTGLRRCPWTRQVQPPPAAPAGFVTPPAPAMALVPIPLGSPLLEARPRPLGPPPLPPSRPWHTHTPRACVCVGAGVQRGVRARRGGGASRDARGGLLRHGGGRAAAMGGVGGVPLARARCAPPVETWARRPATWALRWRRPPAPIGSKWQLTRVLAGRDNRVASPPGLRTPLLSPPAHRYLLGGAVGCTPRRDAAGGTAPARCAARPRARKCACSTRHLTVSRQFSFGCVAFLKGKNVTVHMCMLHAHIHMCGACACEHVCLTKIKP
jgi:hypothetical protein